MSSEECAADVLAKQWLEEENDLTYDKLHYLVLTTPHLSPSPATLKATAKKAAFIILF